MSRIRMNTEFRNKILNRYVESAEKEITQEQQAFQSTFGVPLRTPILSRTSCQAWSL